MIFKGAVVGGGFWGGFFLRGVWFWRGFFFAGGGVCFWCEGGGVGGLGVIFNLNCLYTEFTFLPPT